MARMKRNKTLEQQIMILKYRLIVGAPGWLRLVKHPPSAQVMISGPTDQALSWGPGSVGSLLLFPLPLSLAHAKNS